MEAPLQFADVSPRRLVATVGVGRVVRVDARHGLRQPRAGPLGERSYRFT
jgi:hypothetical protein